MMKYLVRSNILLGNYLRVLKQTNIQKPRTLSQIKRLSKKLTNISMKSLIWRRTILEDTLLEKNKVGMRAKRLSINMLIRWRRVSGARVLVIIKMYHLLLVNCSMIRIIFIQWKMPVTFAQSNHRFGSSLCPLM